MNSNKRWIGRGLAGVAAVALAVPGVGAAHSGDRGWERGGREEAVVLLYAQPDFRGEAIAVYPGEAVVNLADVWFPDGTRANDRVRSIAVWGSASVVVYEHSEFRGGALRATQDLRDLSRRWLPESRRDWSDRISSLRVESAGREGRPERVSPERAERAVRAAYREVLGRDADGRGLRFYVGQVLEQGWTGEMVAEALRASDEFRGERADRWVQAAYRDVLRREPDAAGWRHYRRLILTRDWDAERVRADLRRSAEYRQRVAWGR